MSTPTITEEPAPIPAPPAQAPLLPHGNVLFSHHPHNAWPQPIRNGTMLAERLQESMTPPTKCKAAMEATSNWLYRIYLVADRMGERIADFLGITDSRFQYAIDEHERRQEKKRKNAKREQAELQFVNL
eukprot:NODE_6579_length_521_cov_12.134518_g6414_i0.p1 GENE.NODE_6579_length_521_cov_12.134518_g6414_i0~~NODE_6579_length_521_cov_12.134518_g6414_i0.p1  ORF type:complete len:129 (-),score=14.38 NODE_6579_length_521_cov_12.134518_g6414_i0:59-445(-)